MSENIFGVALSVYKRIDELETNVNIIRKHWNNNCVISVCCNDSETFARLQENKEINILVAGGDIPSNPKPFLRARQWDTITRSTMGVAFSEVAPEFVIHWHADAFAVRKEQIEEIIQTMKINNKLVAFRGRGLEYRTDKCLWGDCDDHYLIFNCRELIARNFFDLENPIQLLSQCNVESLLAKQIKEKFKPEEIYHYSNMSECEIDLETARPDAFYRDGLMHRNMHKFNHDRTRGFFHSADQQLSRKFLLESGIPEEMVLMKPLIEKKPEDKDLNDWVNS